MTLIMLVYYGSKALTPHMLQGELKYPVPTAWPRDGAARLRHHRRHPAGRAGPRETYRPQAADRFACVSALSLYLMSGWSLNVSASEIVWLGVLQGSSIGFINVPLTTNAFTTLDDDLRTEASGFYNLMRNIGSAAGISITRRSWCSRRRLRIRYLSEFMTPFRQMTMPPGLSGTAGLMAMNANITLAATEMIAYINVFMILAVLCLLIIPVVLFLHRPLHADDGRAGGDRRVNRGLRISRLPTWQKSQYLKSGASRQLTQTTNNKHIQGEERAAAVSGGWRSPDLQPETAAMLDATPSARPTVVVPPFGVATAELSAIGGFALGTGEFASMGLLPNVARDIDVSILMAT